MTNLLDLSPSQMITQRSIEKAVSRDLADVVRQWLVLRTADNAESVERALQAYYLAHGLTYDSALVE